MSRGPKLAGRRRSWGLPVGPERDGEPTVVALKCQVWEEYQGPRGPRVALLVPDGRVLHFDRDEVQAP